MKNRAPVHLHAGAAEDRGAGPWYLDNRSALQPGESAWARVVLKTPALLLPGDRFIIRMFSPVVTIGGGTVIDISAHKYASGEDADARLQTLRPGHLVSEAVWGISEGQLIAWTGLREVAVLSEIELSEIEAFGGWLISRARVTELKQQLTATCRAFHREHSLLSGIQKQDLKAAVMAGAPAEVFDYVLAAAPELTQDGEIVRLKSHRVVLKQDEEQARAAVESSFDARRSSPPPP